MHQIKRLAVLFLAAAIFCASCPVPNTVYATEESAISVDNEIMAAEEPEEPETFESESISVTYINPLYRDVLHDSDLLQPEDPQIAAYSVADYAETQYAAGLQLRDYIKNRQETFTIYYQSADAYYEGLSTDIVEYALEHTGDPTEGDYLRWQYAGFKARITVKNENNIYYFELEYTFTYYTSPDQESEVTQSIQHVLSQLNLADKNDYEKIYEIYKYICQHVTYDNAHLNDENYKLKFTAYAALKHGTAVCQGYALLFYRLALESGIDTRIISGKGNNANHGWNIVRLNGVYYNLDATWDASPADTDYAWFLKCDENFSNHMRDPRYADADFYTAYPMSANDYSGTMTDISAATVSLPDSLYTYTGSLITPEVNVICADRTLSEHSNYNIIYTDNLNAGTALITITGIGNYTGNLTLTFTIAPRSISMSSVITIPDQTYNGREITPDLTVMDGDRQLTAQTDYTLFYTDNVHEGTAGILVSGIGNYTGTLNASFKIVSSIADGWQMTDGKWYYYTNHIRQTGWVKDKNKWYYLNSDGAMLTGWQRISGKWYYMNGSGAMVNSDTRINGKTHRFNSSGAWLGEE